MYPFLEKVQQNRNVSTFRKSAAKSQCIHF